MNGLATLPGIPESALDGLPPPEDMPSLGHRRRYAQALACARTGDKAYEFTLWDHWQIPLFVMLRAEQEDWPAVGVPRVATLIQLAPLPDNPADLFRRAAGNVPEPIRLEVTEQLTYLWLGEDPPRPSPEAPAFIGRAMWNAGRAAREEAVVVAQARADELCAAEEPEED